MDFRFYRSEPDAPINWPGTQDFTFTPFERHNDFDAINHLGFDFYGAYGDGELIDKWADDQPLESIDRDQLPDQLTWFPSPFSDPEA